MPTSAVQIDGRVQSKHCAQESRMRRLTENGRVPVISPTQRSNESPHDPVSCIRNKTSVKENQHENDYNYVETKKQLPF